MPHSPTPEARPQAAMDAWEVVPSPSWKSPTDWNFLNAVSAVGDQAWAVGSFQRPGDCCVPHALIEHWDGDRWSVVSNPGAHVSVESPLNGVAAVSATDVWAVGQLGDQPLVEHWDGDRWSVVPNPEVTSPAWLDAVIAVAEKDIWAVGSMGRRPCCGSRGTSTGHGGLRHHSLGPARLRPFDDVRRLLPRVLGRGLLGEKGNVRGQ